MLLGAPTYPEIAPVVAELIRDRVLVAHNANFDWGFLHAESARVPLDLGCQQRLCTVALARRLKLRLPNLKLSTLARWAQVTQQHAHTADDDVLVLQAIFLKLASQALLSGIALPASLDITPCNRSEALGFNPVFEAPRVLLRASYPTSICSRVVF